MTDINRNEAWKVESTGIDRVPDAEQTGKPIELFWIWSAANIGILGVVYGAIIVGFGLSFLQSVLAALVGVASFVLVGLTSFAGKRGRTSTLTLSRVIFGLKGNVAPTLFSWINLMGWEAVNVITGTLTLAALFEAFGLGSSHLLTALSLLLFGGLTVVVSLLGQNTVVWMQSWFSRIFGTMTLIVVLYILFNTEWSSAGAAFRQLVDRLPAGGIGDRRRHRHQLGDCRRRLQPLSKSELVEQKHFRRGNGRRLFAADAADAGRHPAFRAAARSGQRRQPHRADRLSAARPDGDPLSAGRHRRHRHHRGAQPVFRQP